MIQRDDQYFYVVSGYIEQGFSELYRLNPGGTPEPLTGQETRNRFGSNDVTNPYDLVPASDGGFLVSGSGINAILHVSESGEISEYLHFPRRENPQPADGPAEFEVVPTGLDRGPDGAVYVATPVFPIRRAQPGSTGSRMSPGRGKPPWVRIHGVRRGVHRGHRVQHRHAVPGRRRHP